MNIITKRLLHETCLMGHKSSFAQSLNILIDLLKCTLNVEGFFGHFFPSNHLTLTPIEIVLPKTNASHEQVEKLAADTHI